MEMTCDAAMRLSASFAYFGRNFFLIATDGCVISTPFCASFIAKSNPSSGVAVFKLGSQLFISLPPFCIRYAKRMRRFNRCVRFSKGGLHHTEASYKLNLLE